METKSGAKIAIRGKGSVKEGKGRSDAAHTSNQEEDLHCLIMADTEEKVNKAKELIHQVIETVCRCLQPFIKNYANHLSRLLPFPRAKTSSNATSFASLPLSTVLSVMTRTKLARIAAKLVIASTTVPTRRTLLPTSSAVSVVMPVTLPRTVPTALAARTGAITSAVALEVPAAAVLVVVSKLALAMLLTKSTQV
jgi:hypothetical protein